MFFKTDPPEDFRFTGKMMGQWCTRSMELIRIIEFVTIQHILGSERVLKILPVF